MTPLLTHGPDAIRVYLLAKTQECPDDLHRWLDSLGGRGIMGIAHGTPGELVVELAGRRCYRSFAPGLNPNVSRIRTDYEAYLENIVAQEHGAVVEHASATFAFEGVSRVFTHELVRHRAGCAYSQESLRYVRLSDELRVWMPDCIADSPEAVALFAKAVAQDRENQLELERIFAADLTPESPFSRKKELTSAFRRIAPDGLSTGIVATFNLRALRHLISLRTALSAEEEIRIAFDKVAKMAVVQWPALFQDFRRTEAGEWKSEHPKI